MRNLQSTLKTDIKQLSNDEVRERKSVLLKLIERTENLSKMVHNLLECSNSEDEVDKIMANYSNISQLKGEYVKDINNKVKITKQELINESKLDIFSFQSEFLKIYERTTP